MPDGEDAVPGNAITFDSVTRKHAGTYECMASNGIGEPAIASVDISVQCESTILTQTLLYRARHRDYKYGPIDLI